MSEPHNKSSASIFAKYAKRVCDESRIRLWASMLLEGSSSADMLLEFPSADIWISYLRRSSAGRKVSYGGQTLVCAGSALLWVTPSETETLCIFSRKHGKLIMNPFDRRLAPLPPFKCPLIGVGWGWGERWSHETIEQLDKLESIDSTFNLAWTYGRFEAAATPLTSSMEILLHISRKAVNDLSSENRSYTISLLRSIWFERATNEGPHNWVSPRGDDPTHVDKLSTEQFLVRGLKHFGSDTINRMIQMAEKCGYPDNALGKALTHMSKFQSY